MLERARPSADASSCRKSSGRRWRRKDRAGGDGAGARRSIRPTRSWRWPTTSWRARAAVSPIDGFVVSGDLCQLLGTPVEQGKTLFQIAPLDEYRVVLEVDERDLPIWRSGQHGELALSGMPSDSACIHCAARSRRCRGRRTGATSSASRRTWTIRRIRAAAGHGGRRQDRRGDRNADLDLDAQPRSTGCACPPGSGCPEPWPAGERFLSTSWYRVADRAAAAARARAGAHAPLPRPVVVPDQRRPPRRVHRLSPAACAGHRARWMAAARVAQLWRSPTGAWASRRRRRTRSSSCSASCTQPTCSPATCRRMSPSCSTRGSARTAARCRRWLLNPLALRFPLLDPDAFLTRRCPWCAAVLEPLGRAAVAGGGAAGAVAGAAHWPELTDNVGDRVLPADNLLSSSAGLSGHQAAARTRPRLRDQGATAARCTNSASCCWCCCRCPMSRSVAAAGFRSQIPARCLVGAAGIMVELFIAALALLRLAAGRARPGAGGRCST